MRLVGPNCLGVINTADGVAPERDLRAGDCHRRATSASSPRAERSAWRSSSSPRDRGLGVSSFASIGNRADITANDLLEYWEEDPDDRASRCSTSSRSATRGASRGWRRGSVARSRSSSSRAAARWRAQRATSSHTGALLSASDVTVDALFEQAGVIRTETPRRAARRRLAAAQPAAAGRGRASASSPTRAARGSCAPTPARPPGSRCRRCPAELRGALARAPAARGVAWRTRST